MSALLIKLLLSYLIGSVVGSLLLGKLKGVDIRQQGSGNAGATNALRTQGKGFALGTALIDVGKGILAAWLIAPYGGASGGLGLPETQLACGMAAALGHCYPVFHGFRGGKGAGTLIGAVAALFPYLALGMLAVWAVVLGIGGYVGLATVCAGWSFPLWLWLAGGASPTLIALGIAVALFLNYTHRSNLARLREGTEHRFEKARWLHRLVARG